MRACRLLRRLAGRVARLGIKAPPAELAALPYELFRRERLRARAALGREPRPGLLSFVTTVWNTPPDFLRTLAGSLLPQLAGGQEWVLLDNGSSARDVVALVEELGRAPGVRRLRAERNLGIIGGMRHCLERARGRYVVPVDSDDLLSPDCARLLAGFLQGRDYPALLYTDEDKLEGERFFQAYFKPDWDPVLFVNSCYIAHLCAFDRARALELGAYSDASAEGCHDWDTYLRFYLAGHTPRHLPEVLYSWRLHPQSTSADIGAKDYIQSSHHAVLLRLLRARGAEARFTLELSPLFGGTPDRWFRRRRIGARALTEARLTGGAAGAPLREAANRALAEGGLVHLLAEGARPAGDEWPWEALGLMELFPDCVLVGGRVHGADRKIRAAGMQLGYGWGCGSPDSGRALDDPGFFAQMWKQHSVDAVSSQHAVVDPAFLIEALEQLHGVPVSQQLLGPWLGLHARRSGRRVIYSPFVQAESERPWEDEASPAERLAFVRAAADRLRDSPLASPHLGLWTEAAYQPVTEQARRGHLERLAQAASA